MTLSGKGLKKRGLKNIAVAGPVSFQLAAVGSASRRLARKGRVTITMRLTFYPSGGDPSSQSIRLKLKKRVRPPALD